MKTRPLYVDLIILALLAALVWIVISDAKQPARGVSASSTAQVSATAAVASSSIAKATSEKPAATSSKSAIVEKGLNTATKPPSSAASSSLYSTPALAFSTVNESARSALVNILCVANGNAMQPISGSGVLIDPRGVVLTNAHVAQYVLLSEVAQLDLRCSVRSGSPARGDWIPEVMYIPPTWVEQHASELTEAHPLGTGEHDYALLYIVGAGDGAPLPAQFPSLTPDTRASVLSVGSQVLAASYPAEFLGSSVATALPAASTVTSIGQLLTFSTSSVDAISVGGVIEAQSGSSGGAIVNAWDRLIGVITTTSVGTTTSQRDLRAVTLSYINSDLVAQTGKSLSALLAEDPALSTRSFTREEAQPLAQLLANQLER